MLTTKAGDLDISQLLDIYTSSSADEFAAHQEQFENTWFSMANPHSLVSSVNALFAGLKAMKDDHLEKWTTEDIKNYGKFIKIFSPDEITKLGGDNVTFSHELVSEVVSPSLSLSQLTSIYKRYKAQNATEDAEESLHPLLLSALSSADLMSPTPPFIWSRDKDDILRASVKFTPGQMRGLHEIMYPAKWNPSNLSSIIANHPTCLDEVPPKEMKENLAKLMGGIRAAGHDKFYHIAEKIQTIPRYLKVAWLEGALDSRT